MVHGEFVVAAAQLGAEQYRELLTVGKPGIFLGHENRIAGKIVAVVLRLAVDDPRLQVTVLDGVMMQRQDKVGPCRVEPPRPFGKIFPALLHYGIGLEETDIAQMLQHDLGEAEIELKLRQAIGACRTVCDGGVADIDDEAEMRAITTASRPGVRLGERRRADDRRRAE